MLRRSLLKGAAGVGLLPGMMTAGHGHSVNRVRPSERGWPSPDEWARLSRAVGGRLSKVDTPPYAELFGKLHNPFFVGDSVGLTETLGWTDAWTSKPSAYAVLAENSGDVAAAVNFARKHRLRLVVKGGGHSYLGGSNAPDSLLIWTRAMRDVTLHDSFAPRGCGTPEPAVSIGSGAMWLDAYEAVTTKGGRYVQGGGCTTVGVAGLVLGGGFGSFSKQFGTAAANLLEAEIVTADGVVRIANTATNVDLFWALKGGGGGSFGVVTRVTLRTHELPNFVGAVNATITAASDTAYRALVEQMMSFYAKSLLNPHWGEQFAFQPGRQLSVNMVFQGLEQAQAQSIWAPFFGWVAERSADYTMPTPTVIALPARHFWNPDVIGSVPGIVKFDDRPGAPKRNFYWAGDAGQVAQVLHSYQSTWLSRRLLRADRRPELVDALVRGSSTWRVSLHCNKGIAGAPAQAVARTAATAMNPAVLDAFALVIVAANEPPAYPGIPGHEPNVAKGRRDAQLVDEAIAPVKALSTQQGSYVSETDYFEPHWQRSFWGANYPRLKRTKDRYDPGGLFFVHHGVGSEGWSKDGFTKI